MPKSFGLSRRSPSESQAERAPAPAFWAGKKDQGAVSFRSAPRRGLSADWPAPGRKLGLYLQLITPRPMLPPPGWRQKTTGGACITPPLLELTLGGRGLRKTQLPLQPQTHGCFIKGDLYRLHGTLPLGEGKDNIMFKAKTHTRWELVHSLASYWPFKASSSLNRSMGNKR